jgi:hypothetical protein|tara:strand:- start:1068 stop:1763 length:696 start_codon:yes stop_codon:yes gene_type:complete
MTNLRIEYIQPAPGVDPDRLRNHHVENHIQPLLAQPGWQGASRYELDNATIGDIPNLLTIYYLDESASTEADVEPPGEESDESLLSLWYIGYYRRSLVVGKNTYFGENSPPAIMVTLTFPNKGTPALGLNEWYDGHIGDITTTDGFRGAARYKLDEMILGYSSPYLAVYELETDDIGQVARNLDDNRDRWLSGDPSSRYYSSTGPMPETVHGERWIGVDGFAYYRLLESFG